MSALLTTTMTYMKTVIDGFEAAGQGHIKMAIGGAPISQMFADEIGADGYGQNASAAVDLFLQAGEAGLTSWPPTRSSTGRKSRRRSRPRTIATTSRCRSIHRFMERIDQLAAQRGLQGADDYLAQWKWSDEQERDGTAEDVARAIKAELEAGDRLVVPATICQSP